METAADIRQRIARIRTLIERIQNDESTTAGYKAFAVGRLSAEIGELTTQLEKMRGESES